MAGSIIPDEVKFVFENGDGTSTVIDQGGMQIIPQREGEMLSQVLKKRQRDAAKIAKEAASTPIVGRGQIERRPPNVFTGPGGRTIDIKDVMQTKRRGT